jgi:O-antigen ligase
MASIIDKHGNIDFFGRASWANFLDWLITLCLGGIIILTTISLGGVRPDTHVALLPFFVLLLTLHGIWLALPKDAPMRLSYVPLWYVPAILWMLCSVLWWSPVPWRGWHELIYTLQVFIVFWVISNNVRTRAHLWVLIVMALMPSFIAIFNGFYQFFQDPGRMLGALTDYRLELNEDFLGRATGSFADPDSFAAFLTIVLPALIIAGTVPRLPKILRILALYIALMVLLGIAFTQAYWAAVLAVLILAFVPWFCFKSIKRSFFVSLVFAFSASLIFGALVTFHPLFKKGLEQASSVDGEGVRLVLWEEALAITAEHPLIGVGAGAYGAAFEQSQRVSLADLPTTPHNDYLLVLSQLGLVGACLFGLPTLFVFLKAWWQWKQEPFDVHRGQLRDKIMPAKRFFLSCGLTSGMAFAFCLGLTFVFYVPALTLYGVLVLSILAKNSFKQGLQLPEHWVLRFGYSLLAICAGASFYVLASGKLEAQALEIRARQQLEHIIDRRIHVSGNKALLDQVILFYEDALVNDAKNVDAWIGLSASVCQLYFKDPGDFSRIGLRATAAAERATQLSPDYWKTWAQLGVASAFYGDSQAAESALAKALEIAPKSSNANYYFAAYLSSFNDRKEEALEAVGRALQINPANAAARRLQQKLLIL